MDLKGKQILIVEDNPLNRIVYQIALTRYGAQLTFDNWGRDIISKLKSRSVWDLIVLDLMLAPYTSGFDILRQIRSLPAYATVPIVAISAAEPDLAIPKAKEYGFSGFIPKPIDEAEIADQLSRIIDGQELWLAFPAKSRPVTNG